MIRKLAVVAAVLAAAVGARPAAAQSSASSTQKSTAAPAAKPAPTTTAKVDTGAKTTAKKTTTSTTHHAAWTANDIKAAQEGLAKAGYYKGKVTGKMNADTEKALKAYQKQQKLPVTGHLSDSVLVRLKSV
jgi:peptidoglycan hydrolase-like protein with peptidoglycan-binding domain